MTGYRSKYIWPPLYPWFPADTIADALMRSPLSDDMALGEYQDGSPEHPVFADVDEYATERVAPTDEPYPWGRKR